MNTKEYLTKKLILQPKVLRADTKNYLKKLIKIKYLPFLFILFTISSCSTINYKTDTEMLFAASAPSDRISIHCSPLPEPPGYQNSFTYVYLVGEKRVDKLIYRRAWPIESCHYHRENMNKILTKAKVATLHGEFKSDAGLSKKHPDHLNNYPVDAEGKKLYTWYFVKLTAQNECYSYFKHDCEKPASTREK